jgi:hypothetical protein
VIEPLIIRPADPADRPNPRTAIIELQEYERLRHRRGYLASRSPTPISTDASQAGVVVLVAELADNFLGFVAGWIEQTNNLAETADSNRFGYISDICVLPPFP